MSNHNTGPLGYGIPLLGCETELFKNFVWGAFVKKGTTAPAQLTGTGNGTFKYDISDGVVIVDGTALDIAAAADTNLETPGNILANGQSKVYTVIAWKSPSTGVVAIKVVGGTVATTGSQVAPTTAQIEAAILTGAKWVPLGSTTINRTGDTAATQTGTTNLARPLLLPVIS